MARPVTTVEICDPQTGKVMNGPDVPFAMEMPLAAHLKGRVFVAGEGKLLSIGSGEKGLAAGAGPARQFRI